MSSHSFYETLHKALKELGLITLWNSTLDTKLICAQRVIRLVAYGGSTLILVSFLSALEISKAKIGLFMTLTMIGDLVISFICTTFADMAGRKNMLATGALMMVGAGVVFALCENFWVLLVAAVIGVISVNGTECGPFRVIEESTIAHLTEKEDRSDIYAWYGMLAGIGTAFGLGLCGLLVNALVKSGRSTVQAYHAVFWAYSALGLVMLCTTLFLSKACELKRELASPVSSSSSETGVEITNAGHKKPSLKSRLPRFSRKSRPIVIKLCILFALDSFAFCLVPLSWITSFFHDKFNLAENKLGTIFFCTALVAALSNLPASSLARRLGNVNTMIFTNLFGAIVLALIPIPTSVSPAVVLLVLRSSTQAMPATPRSAFLAGVVPSEERTPILGLIMLSRSTFSTFSPLITGVLAGKGLLWVAFIAAGALMGVYDLALWLMFHGFERSSEGSDGMQDVESFSETESEGEKTRVGTLMEEKKEAFFVQVAVVGDTTDEVVLGDLDKARVTASLDALDVPVGKSM